MGGGGGRNPSPHILVPHSSHERPDYFLRTSLDFRVPPVKEDRVQLKDTSTGLLGYDDRACQGDSVEWGVG